MQILRHRELLTWLKKGVRNGNWRRLNRLERALYRASIWYSRHYRCIVNMLLVEKLSTIVETLRETPSVRIFKKGFERAVELLERYEESGVFSWAPRMREWLKDPSYIFWLGRMG